MPVTSINRSFAPYVAGLQLKEILLGHRLIHKCNASNYETEVHSIYSIVLD